MALDTPSEVNISSWELMKLQVLTKEVQSSRQLKLTAIFAYSSGEQLAREEREGGHKTEMETFPASRVQQ